MVWYGMESVYSSININTYTEPADIEYLTRKYTRGLCLTSDSVYQDKEITVLDKDIRGKSS